MASSTRLLVLGALRFMQPAHGYEIRRELISWRLEDVANVKPGSIYGAIRTLEKDACIAVHAREQGEHRPDKTTYTLTAEGEKEFQLLLREAWWSRQPATEPFVVALSLMPNLPRDELVRALAARIGHLEAEMEGLSFKRDAIIPGDTGAEGTIPGHVREIIGFLITRNRAELDWARQFQKRVRDGEYHFTGDAGFPDLGPGKGWHS